MERLLPILGLLIFSALSAVTYQAQSLLLLGAGGAGGAAAVVPTVVFSDFTSTDGTGTSFNQSTISINVTGPNPLLTVCAQSEFDDSGNTLFWNSTYNGVLGNVYFWTDGYAEPKTLICWYWVGSNLSAGTHDAVTTLGVRAVPAAGSQELTVAAILYNNAAQVTYPFRGTSKDISGSNRSSENCTTASAVNDLVIHVMATSLFTPGTPGAGETIIVNAQDGTDDASLLFTRKAGAAATTNVSSSGWAGTFPLQGLCMSIMPAGTAEPLTIFADTFQRANQNPLSKSGAWTAPAGATVGAVALVSNVATGSGVIEDIAQISTPSFAAGQRSVGVIASGAAGTFIRLWVRSSNSGGYMATFSGVGDMQIFSVANSGAAFSYTQLGATETTPFNFAAGDTLEVEVTGTTINVYWDGLLFTSRTSAAFATGQPGLGSFGAIPIVSNYFASTLPVRN